MADTRSNVPPVPASAGKLLGRNPQSWLAAIVESSDDAIIGKTLDSIIRSWNSGATRMFGYEPGEMIGHSVYQLIPPELHFEEPAIVARLERGERIDHYETERLRKDGTRINVSLSISPIRDPSGQIVGAAKLARDITEAKRLQHAEREMLDQLQQMATELEQQVEEGQQLQSELEQQVEQGQALQQELEETNEDLNRSLTDARRAREEAEAALKAADAANAAKSQFLAVMSHELRTPLNAIAGYVDLLDAGVRGELTPEQRGDLARIKRSEETLLRLIDGVLNFARLESGRLSYRYQDVCLHEVLSSLEGFMAPRLGQKELGYEFEPCGSDIVVRIDRDKVEQIMLNLLSNAVKFTDHGRILVRCAVDDATLEISVHDTGRGIPPELLETIFEPFVQGDHSLTRTAEGTGLGLSISRQLARGMGGDITAASKPGDGSLFTLRLPRHPEG